MAESTELRTDSLLALLRAETSDAHEALDHAHEGGDFADLSGYGRFLESQARLFPPLETWLAGSDEFRTLPEWRDRLRSPALMSDLNHLGLAPPKPMPFLCEDRPGSAAGLAYVLEGSRLGGKLIARRLGEAKLAAPVEFITQGDDRRFWPSFTSWLSTREAGQAYVDAAIAAARAAFEGFLEATRRSGA
jgi:heme oxygenase